MCHNDTLGSDPFVLFCLVDHIKWQPVQDIFLFIDSRVHFDEGNAFRAEGKHAAFRNIQDLLAVLDSLFP